MRAFVHNTQSGDAIIYGVDNGKIYFQLKSLCNAIGLRWETIRKRIRNRQNIQSVTFSLPDRNATSLAVREDKMLQFFNEIHLEQHYAFVQRALAILIRVKSDLKGTQAVSDGENEEVEEKVNPIQLKILKKLVVDRVNRLRNTILGGMDDKDYHWLYSAIYTDLNREMGIDKVSDLPKSKYNEAIAFLKKWTIDVSDISNAHVNDNREHSQLGHSGMRNEIMKILRDVRSIEERLFKILEHMDRE
ncbi:MAG: hypothetical protein D6732_08385 [Methanobacteriota archaeon]|nr:MAG: hypothetical protein D6732_08385 [Euryarchaeota archaeon]